MDACQPRAGPRRPGPQHFHSIAVSARRLPFADFPAARRHRLTKGGNVKNWRVRVGAALLVAALGAVVGGIAAAGPAHASLICSGQRFADNGSSTVGVEVRYRDCNDGTYRIASVAVHPARTIYGVTLVIRRYQPDQSTVISWQGYLGTVTGGGYTAPVLSEMVFDKRLNPYAYVRYQPTASAAHRDSAVTRLPWV
jgi:hypothetical protein